MASDQTNSTDSENSGRTVAASGSATEGRPTENPLVTVVITTYNRPAYLEDAVKSVFDQTYDPIELVVVDDHSDTPASQTLANTASDKLRRIEIVRHDQNRGANAGRNTGIQEANGKYLAFLDDDDTWMPTKIARQVAVMERNDDVGFSYTGQITATNSERRVDTKPQIEGNITKALLCWNVVGTLSSVMVRTALAKEIPFDETFPCWADLEWYISLSTETNFHRIPEPLLVWDLTSHNRLSEDLNKKQKGYELFLMKFDDLALQYGTLFRRKMRAWAAYRLGATALTIKRYNIARRLLLRAVWRYPFEKKFVGYFFATLGGQYTHKPARSIKQLVSDLRI